MQDQPILNQIKFDVEFTKESIQELLNNSSVEYLVISGTYSYMGENGWGMEVWGDGYDCEHNKINLQRASGCPRPCPTS